MGWSGVLILSFVVLGGCDAPVTSLDAPDTGVVRMDAGRAAAPDASLTSPDSGPPDAPTLTVRAATREYDITGARIVPIDTRTWRASVIQAGVVMGSASGDTDGVFRGLPAPPGERTVIVERPDWPAYAMVIVVGTSSTIDLIDAVARHETTAAPRDTSLVLDVDGLTPWDERDRLLVFSGAAADHALDLGNLPLWPLCISPGATRLTSCRVDWSGRALLRGRRQDDILIGRYTAFEDGEVYGHRLTALGRTDRLALTPGMSTTVAVTLATLPMTSLNLTLGDPREDSMTLFGPGTRPPRADLVVGFEARGGLRERWWYLGPQIFALNLSWRTVGARTVDEPMHIALDGFETYLAYEWTAQVDHDNGMRQTFLSAGVSMPLADAVAADTVRLPLSAPREITIDGRTTTGVLRGVSLTPRIAWQAPAFGAPDGYQISVLGIGPRNTTTLLQLFTTHPSIDIPSGALPADTIDYLVLVRARQGGDLTREPFGAPATKAWATATTDINLR